MSFARTSPSMLPQAEAWHPAGASVGFFVAFLSLALFRPAVSPAQISDDAAFVARVKSQVSGIASRYQTRVDPQRKLVFITALDDESFRRTAAMLATYSDAYSQTMNRRPPSVDVVIILPTVADYQPLAPSTMVRGFYMPSERMLVSIDRGPVLMHEFTHALHHADIAATGQNPPIWIKEGLATLFDSSEITPQGLVPEHDARLIVVRQMVKAKTLMTIQELSRLDYSAFRNNAVPAYAQSRYVLFYLYEKGVLAQWYQKYNEDFSVDPTGVRAMEAMLNRRIFQIEDDWREWILQLKPPRQEADQARLGVELRDTPEGPRVVSLLDGGAAAQAGRLQVGDVIVKFAGSPTRNSLMVFAALKHAGAYRTVDIEVIRDGQRVTFQQPIGSSEESP